MEKAGKRLALERLVHCLKESDSTVFRVCQKLVLRAYLRVVYRTKYTFVMVDRVVDLLTLHVEAAQENPDQQPPTTDPGQVKFHLPTIRLSSATRAQTTI